MTSSATDNLPGLDNETVLQYYNATTSLPAPIYFTELAVEKALIVYVLPVIILVGTVGNVTSFIVLLRSRMCNTSVYLFLLILAVFDTMVLYVSGFKTWIRVLTDFELMSVNNTTCRLVSFSVILSQHMAAWIVVLVTVDRFVAVWFPLRATSWCTVSRAWLATLVTTVAVIAYGLHVFWTFEVRSTGRPICVPAKRGQHVPDFMLKPFNLLILVTYCVLPFVIILALNVAIIARLRWTPPAFKSNTELNTMSGVTSADTIELTNVRSANARWTTSTASRVAQQAKVTYMLLTVSTVWLLLTAPFCLSSLIVQQRSLDQHTAAIERLAKSICFLLMYTNHSINFFLYCLTGRKFRRELIDLVAKLCQWPTSRWRLTGSSSVKTLRSNCAELEQLNESTRSPYVGTHHQSYHHRQQCYVTDVVNDVTAVASRDHSGGPTGSSLWSRDAD